MPYRHIRYLSNLTSGLFLFFSLGGIGKEGLFFLFHPPPPKKKDNIQQIQGVAERQVNHSLPGIMDCLGRVVCPRVGN